MYGNDYTHLNSKFEAHILSNIYEMNKIKIMDFTLSIISFDNPQYPNDTPKFHLIYIKRCVIDVKTITQKHLTQFIGQNTLFKKILEELQQPPLLRRTSVNKLIFYRTHFTPDHDWIMFEKLI